MSEPVEVVLVGAGLRGRYAYGMHAASAGVRFVGVVDPVEARRDAFGAEHAIAPDRRYASVASWLDGPRLASAAIVATPDDQHLHPVLAALGSGHDVLVEKPMAPTLAECVQMVEAAEAAGRQLHVCHVLRYTAFFGHVREIVASGRLGRIVTVEHRENVDARHMAHSYVRGAYRRGDRSAPMLLAKSCHDLDLLHWILGDPVARVASFGSLLHFRPDAVGPEIPPRCTDGCPVEPECTFSAVRAYAPDEGSPAHRDDSAIALLTRWFPIVDPSSSEVGADDGLAERRAALATSPYGRCVYRCDNDVVDHQVVAMELASGATVAFTMHGHSHEEGRTMRYDGTEATLLAAFTDHPEITVHPHGGGPVERIDLATGTGIDHGGGDPAILAAFARSVTASAGATAGHDVVGGTLTSDGRTSLESHLLAFAAEEARAAGAVVDLAAFRARAGLAT